MSFLDSLKMEAMKKAQELAKMAQESMVASTSEHNQENEVSPLPSDEQVENDVPPLPSDNEGMSSANQYSQATARKVNNVEDSSGDLYDPRMEKLIHAALADGVLTEKEKQVLFKKAETMGIDLDEFEMVLDARLYEKQHNNALAQHQKAAPTSTKYGDVKKCPGCGTMVQSFTTKCPECGYEFHGVGAVHSFSILSAKLEQISKQKDSGLLGLFIGGVDKVDSKRTLIKSFPIPTTREDILEFLTMAAPLAKEAVHDTYREILGISWKDGGVEIDKDGIEGAWWTKCQQIVTKARIAMKEDPDTLAQVENFAKGLRIE